MVLRDRAPGMDRTPVAFKRHIYYLRDPSLRRISAALSNATLAASSYCSALGNPATIPTETSVFTDHDSTTAPSSRTTRCGGQPSIPNAQNVPHRKSTNITPQGPHRDPTTVVHEYLRQVSHPVTTRHQTLSTTKTSNTRSPNPVRLKSSRCNPGCSSQVTKPPCNAASYEKTPASSNSTTPTKTSSP